MCLPETGMRGGSYRSVQRDLPSRYGDARVVSKRAANSMYASSGRLLGGDTEALDLRARHKVRLPTYSYVSAYLCMQRYSLGIPPLRICLCNERLVRGRRDTAASGSPCPRPFLHRENND